MSKSDRIENAQRLAERIENRKQTAAIPESGPSELELWNRIIGFPRDGELDEWARAFRALGQCLLESYCDFWLEQWSKKARDDAAV